MGCEIHCSLKMDIKCFLLEFGKMDAWDFKVEICATQLPYKDNNNILLFLGFCFNLTQHKESTEKGVILCV